MLTWVERVCTNSINRFEQSGISQSPSCNGHAWSSIVWEDMLMFAPRNLSMTIAYHGRDLKWTVSCCVLRQIRSTNLIVSASYHPGRRPCSLCRTAHDHRHLPDDWKGLVELVVCQSNTSNLIPACSKTSCHGWDYKAEPIRRQMLGGASCQGASKMEEPNFLW